MTHSCIELHTDTHSLTHAHTEWVPKRDPRKQEMTAEGRSRSRERTDTSRPLSKRRREGGKERGHSVQYSGRKKHKII